MDLVVLVSEPTPFGFYDLTLMAATLKTLSIPSGVVVNRCDIGNDELYLFCRREGLPILAEIPHDRRIAECYSHGALITEALPEYRELFADLWKQVSTLLPSRPDREGRDGTGTPP
jgi:MinD superfamily P-loop ATPase